MTDEHMRRILAATDHFPTEAELDQAEAEAARYLDAHADEIAARADSEPEPAARQYTDNHLAQSMDLATDTAAHLAQAALNATPDASAPADTCEHESALALEALPDAIQEIEDLWQEIKRRHLAGPCADPFGNCNA